MWVINRGDLRAIIAGLGRHVVAFINKNETAQRLPR